MKGLKYLSLSGNLYALFLFVSLELLDVALEILVLVLGKLQLCLGLERHVLHLRLVGHVLLVDLVDLVLGVAADLVKRLLVVLADLSNVIPQLLSRVLCRFHVLAELLQLFGDTLVMLTHDSIDLVFILQLLLFLLSLQLLIVGGILEHLL